MSNAVRQTRLDGLVAWTLGVCVSLTAWLSGNSLELPPELWEELSVSAGLRPPEREFPALWRMCLSFLVDWCGISGAIRLLKISGPLSLGFLTVLSYALFTGLLPESLRSDGIYRRCGRWVVRLIVAFGTVLFVCSGPVWLAGRVLSPEMTRLFITEIVLLLAFSASRRSSALCMIMTGGVCGILAAETPAAFVLIVLCWYYLDSRRNFTWGAFSNTIVFSVATRRMVCAFLVCWIGMTAVNLTCYMQNSADASGAFFGILRYLFHYFRVLTEAMSPIGWVLVFAVVIAPFVIVITKMRELTDLSAIPRLPVMCLVAFAGVFSFLQSTGFSSFHFWRWESDAAGSGYLLCLCMFATSVASMNVLSIFVVDVYFRNRRRVMRELFPWAAEDPAFAGKALSSMKRFSRTKRVAARFLPAVLVLTVVPYRFDGTEGEMAAVVNDMVYAVSEECAGATMLFSDGSLDAAVEVASAEKGRCLKVLSLMSGQGDYDVAVRLRGETDEGTRALLKKGAAEALKTWVLGDAACVSNIAVQVGFELWGKERGSKFQTGGFVARTVFRSEETVAEGIESAYGIAERIIDLYSRKDFDGYGYPELNRLFVFVQWRLARMCMMRADEADRSKDAQRARKDRELAEALNSLNPEWRKIQKKIDGMIESRGVHLTPREGLNLGLRRADFRIAGHYARQVLAESPGDMQANFALGMRFFIEKNYGEAEEHLRKALAVAPKEPAVLNNLAVVQLRLGHLDEAETNAVKAHALLPASKEIRETLKHIRDAKKEVK